MALIEFRHTLKTGSRWIGCSWSIGEDQRGLPGKLFSFTQSFDANHNHNGKEVAMITSGNIKELWFWDLSGNSKLQNFGHQNRSFSSLQTMFLSINQDSRDDWDNDLLKSNKGRYEKNVFLGDLSLPNVGGWGGWFPQQGPNPSKTPQITPKIALFNPNFTFRSPKYHKNPGMGG